MTSYYRNPRCKVCNSSLRDSVDKMLLGDTTHDDDGSRYTYLEIVDWCAAHGLSISTGGLTRHRNSHLQPALAAALETQAVVDAITAATGKKLSLQTAMTNIVTTMILRRINAASEEELNTLDLENMLKLVPRIAEVGGKLERTEHGLAHKTVEAVGEKLNNAGLEPEVIERIKKDLYGL